MTNHHDAFKALAPIEWSTINQDELKTFLTNTFVKAQALIDSIPADINSKPSTENSTTGRPRSATDPAGPKFPNRAPKTSSHAEHLRKEWKEVQVNPKENTLGVNVYKMASKDKKGAWFARRSIHNGISFDKWKLGMQAEFAESLKVQGAPGSGKIRGIGADRKVVDTVVDGCGKLEVYQLSAQFPGPTTPRDFVTLLLSSDSAIDSPGHGGLAKPRYYMLVSKPCMHPECPPRNGYIRGQYESVEFIREVKVDKPLRKVRSSIDLSGDVAVAARQNAAGDLGKETLTRSAHSAAIASSASDTTDMDSRKRDKTITFAGTEEEEVRQHEAEVETLVEWLMVTRSDPGGSVPRFMVEKGTPAGIAGDAEKFVKWVQSKSPEDLAKVHESSGIPDGEAQAAMLSQADEEQETIDSVAKRNSESTLKADDSQPAYEDPKPSSFYGMIAEALGAFAARLPNPLGSSVGGDTESELSLPGSIDDESDTSSVQSFHSVDSALNGDSKSDSINPISPVLSISRDGEAQSTYSSESATQKALSHHEKELRKLEERKQKATEKMIRAKERAISKKETEARQDETAIAKLKEKHDREIQKQEEKYRRDLKRLEEKRAQEERKAEEKRRKQAEKEAKQDMAMELEKVKAERDVALKQIDVLKEQIGELQGQNTLLVAKLGKKSSPELLESIRRTDSFTSTKKADK